MSDRVIGAGLPGRRPLVLTAGVLAAGASLHNREFCMGLYANTKPAKIGYFNSKIAPWTASATSIGTTTAAVTALNTLVTSAQTKLDDQIAAEQAFKAAVAAADAAVASMVVAGQNIIKDIRAFAANSATPSTVYDLAQIPAPATPTPVSTLGTPTDFVVQLENDGSVTVKWKCSNPRASGTIYQVWRRLESETEFAYLGGTGEKKFTDPTVPAGSATTIYKIQAVRSTAKGAFGICTVLFGVGASGAMTATVVQPKLAA